MQRIGVIGLGYVGLPVAVAFARRLGPTVGFDRDPKRIRELREGIDGTRSVSPEDLAMDGLEWTDEAETLAGCELFVVAVPTPIDEHNQPDFAALDEAARTVGSLLRPGAVVVFESTVYPGVTEERCGRLIEEVSGLRAGVDYGLAYSPERINPGDPEHTLERNVKVCGASDPETLERVASCYEAVCPAGVHRVSSIRVAEAAKVIENVQRDLNIALMNELAMLFERLELDTKEVLDAAATKWNFHSYHPGLVGGHCIGVDPYYLTTLAQSVGLHPRVVLAGRHVNDEMGAFVASKTVKLLASLGRDVRGTRVGVLGIAFKPDVPDLRNSAIPGLVHELREFGMDVACHDPLVDPQAALEVHGLELFEAKDLAEVDVLLFATPHAELLDTARDLLAGERPPVLCIDVLGAPDPEELPQDLSYWRL